jgi:succinate dehydrogenase/fumarate reductase flavoprotein subunit
MAKRDPANREIEADVVIVGYGCAGAVAAFTAHDAGAKVLILEMMAEGGGASKISNGGIAVPLSPEFGDYLYSIWNGLTDREVIDTYVEHGMKLEDYFREIGADFERWTTQEVGISFPPLTRPSWPKVPGGKQMARGHMKVKDPGPPRESMTMAERIRAVGRAYGPETWEVCTRNVEKRRIEMMTRTRVTDLVRNDAGEVMGVTAVSDGQQLFVKAKKAVVLTTGGFAGNEEMKKAYLPCPFHYIGFSSYAQGDGLVMAQKAGAQMWHMLGICGQLCFQAPEYEAAFQTRVPSEKYIIVDQDAKRFTNETKEVLHHMWRITSVFDPVRLIYPRIPCYIIFDETTRAKGPISHDQRVWNDYVWSLDNTAEIAKGWIKKGQTLTELAREIGIDGTTLEHTVATFNLHCKNGHDLDFNRSPDLMGAIDTPPYYAIPQMPTLVSVSGGPRRDKKSRVLDNAGKPIPRLYAAGELGSLFAWLYEAGFGLSECFVFGKIAGQNAAAETSLDGRM